MKEGQKLWTRNELIMAINLYCKLPFGRLYARNPEIIKLANLLSRTPSAVALKLVNFASLDPTLQARGIRGATNSSKLDKVVWDEFYNNWDAAFFESERLLAEMQQTTIEALHTVQTEDIPKEGLDKMRLVKTRVNQSIFRSIVLATYDNTCCITGLNQPELLIASHIMPWAADEKNRLNPMNGLAMNALHDRAFEVGLITIDADDYVIRISSKLKTNPGNENTIANFHAFEGKSILLPKKFHPNPDFLKIHNQTRFKA